MIQSKLVGRSSIVKSVLIIAPGAAVGKRVGRVFRLAAPRLPEETFGDLRAAMVVPDGFTPEHQIQAMGPRILSQKTPNKHPKISRSALHHRSFAKSERPRKQTVAIPFSRIICRGRDTRITRASSANRITGRLSSHPRSDRHEKAHLRSESVTRATGPY